MLSSKLLATQKPSVGGSEPEGVSFDGVTDYLSRSTDLVGNVDSKTFTFSAWVYHISGVVKFIYDTNTRFQVSLNASNQVVVLGKDSTGTTILNATSTVPAAALNTFINITASIDLANTANRSVRINDVLATTTWTTYTNAAVDFTNTTHTVASLNSGSSKLKGRLSHVFLAREYLDLSIESNRRIFITADGKPA